VKLFATQIVFGYSSEARVFAHLLGKRPSDIDVRVLMHESPDDHEPLRRFASTAHCAVVPFDTGWRMNTKGRRLDAERLLVAGRYLRRLGGIRDIAAQYKPDVVYSCQQHYDCTAATTVARKLDKPQIIHLHYVIGPWLKRSVLKRLHTCAHVITVSDFIREEALRHGVPPERVTTVRNAMAPMPTAAKDEIIAVRTELAIPLEAFVFGIVSRIDAGKGHSDTVAAFERVARRMPDARLVVVGSGTIESTIRAQAARSPVSNRITFTGRRSDVPRLLGAMNVFVHPSRKDPCPLAVLEALSSGLPVIAYAEGGAVEMVVDGRTGLLTPVEDVDLLASAMHRLYESPSNAREMGVAARERVAVEFRPEQASEKFAAVVRKVV
jgi:glycosyltransferase involved in cell wall biosynthesis